VNELQDKYRTDKWRSTSLSERKMLRSRAALSFPATVLAASASLAILGAALYQTSKVLN
jgi:hypothetical protein